MACQCVYCSICNGNGHYWLNTRGQVVSHLDDLDVMELCEDCGGTGVSEICDECVYEEDSFDLFLGGTGV